MNDEDLKDDRAVYLRTRTNIQLWILLLVLSIGFLLGWVAPVLFGGRCPTL